MLLNNPTKLSKSQLVSAVQKSKTQNCLVYEISNQSQIKDVEKEASKLVKKGNISIIIIEN